MSEPNSTVMSMTGFARVEGTISTELAFTLSIKSVNHRFLDLSLRLPGGLDGLEIKLRQVLKHKIVRGHVDVTLNLSRTAANRIDLDSTRLAAYVAAFRTAAADLNLAGQPDLNIIFGLPGVITQETRTEDPPEVIESAVLAHIDPLVEALNTMRIHEGAALREDLRASLDRLAASVEQVAAFRQDVQQAYFERLQQRLNKMIDGSFDENRLLQEAALLAERSSIDEELVRMRAHIAHFHGLLDTGGEVGKKLDFLLQEMNREANTLLSKTGGVAGKGSQITEIGLSVKSEIEKAREQLQNLQ